MLNQCTYVVIDEARPVKLCRSLQFLLSNLNSKPLKPKPLNP